MGKIFVISPVRNIDNAVREAIASHVTRLEAEGHKVHWPSRDTNQDDPVGFRICADNREAIYQSGQVHIWFDEGSQGSVFDLGMLFAFLRDTYKDFVLINGDQLGLEDVLLDLGIHVSAEEREEMWRADKFLVHLDTKSRQCLFYLGMIFAFLRNKPREIVLTNRDQISPTPHKSFENVFLALERASQ